MSKRMSAYLSLCAAAFMSISQAHADPLKAEVMHWWTSGSEAAALKVLAKAYNKAGGEWVDHAVPDFDSAIAAGTSAILAGNPPAAMQFNAGTQFADLAKQDYLADLTAYAKEGKWDTTLPPMILKAVTYDGKIYGLPVDNHGENWLWTSKAAFAKAGVATPTSWAEFFPALDKLKAAGIIPIAHGGEPWQEIELFYQVMLFRGNNDLYNAIFVNGDEAALKTPEFKAFAEDFKKMTGYIDAGAPGRKWNDATAMVIQGKAGMQFMGDWAKGEFTAAGQKPGVDFDCLLGFGGKDNFVMISDVFVLPKGNVPEAVHKLLADTIMSKTVQVDFNNVKGGLPARLDVKPDGMDACSAKGFAVMQNPAAQIPGPEITISADRFGAIQDAVSQFWNTPSMTTDAFIDAMQQALESTAG
jgi:glucose/mannose transport system substrate-binding protein